MSEYDSDLLFEQIFENFAETWVMRIYEKYQDRGFLLETEKALLTAELTRINATTEND